MLTPLNEAAVISDLSDEVNKTRFSKIESERSVRRKKQENVREPLSFKLTGENQLEHRRSYVNENLIIIIIIYFWFCPFAPQ